MRYISCQSQSRAGRKAQTDEAEIVSANGTEIALLGEVELTLTMSEHEVTAAVVVSEKVDDLIMGIDWLAVTAAGGRSHRI